MALDAAATQTTSTIHDFERKLVKDSKDTFYSAKNVIETTAHNLRTVGSELTHGKVDPSQYAKLIYDLAKGGSDTAHKAAQIASDSISALNTVYAALDKGGSLSIGNSDGLLGINVFGSALGGNTYEGIIPDERGSAGALPFSFSLHQGQINLGGEVPISSLVLPLLTLTPLTTPLVPLLSPLNLGGLGITGKVTNEGFSMKIYGAAGPSYKALAISANASTEIGSYTDVKLLSWNSISVKDLPLIGQALNSIPAVKDIAIKLPTLDINFDSKLYAQTSANLQIIGIGPNAQIELIHDLDNDISIIGGITKDAIHAALDGAKTVLKLALAPNHQLKLDEQKFSDLNIKLDNIDTSITLVGITENNLTGDALAA